MNTNLSITQPKTNKERLTLQKFYERRIPNVSRGAILTTEFDYASEPYILQVHDNTGRLVGAISSGVAYPVFLGRIGQIPIHLLQKNIDASAKIREIEFIAIDEDFRNQGIASSILAKVEKVYKERNVSVLYGSGVAKDGERELLIKFYEKNGYSISDELPPFFGLGWFDPTSVPDFYFHKKLL